MYNTLQPGAELLNFKVKLIMWCTVLKIQALEKERIGLAGKFNEKMLHIYMF